MQWRQKATFQEILEEKIDSKTKDFYSSDSYFALIERPNIEIQRNPYPRKKMNFRERMTHYVSQWPESKQQTWQDFHELAQLYKTDVYPWAIQSGFRKLVKVVHPDLNTSPKAKDDFRRLYSLYNVLK